MQSFEKIYLEDNIYCIENFISNEEADKILSMNLDWKINRNDIHENIFTASIAASSNQENYKYFKENIEDRIKLVVDDENQRLRKRDMLTKYVGGLPKAPKEQLREGFDYDLTWHYENHPECDFESRWITLGIVLYFNDDYEGGELVFQHKPISIKPKRGSLMVFPATEEYSHAVKKTISGERVVYAAFVYGKQYWDILERSGLFPSK